jgi:hypothetical protein
MTSSCSCGNSAGLRVNPALRDYIAYSGAVLSCPLWEMDGQEPRDYITEDGDPGGVGARQLTIYGGGYSIIKSGQFGEAPVFDGSNDYLGHVYDANYAITGELTLVSWLKKYDAAAVYAVLSCSGDSANNAAKNMVYNLTIREDGTPRLYWEYGTGTASITEEDTGGDPVPPDIWTFIAVTRASDGVVNWYRGTDDDDVELTYTSGTNTMPTGGTTTRLRVGANARRNDQLWRGSLNGALIFDSELSLSDMQALHSYSKRVASSVAK